MKPESQDKRKRRSESPERERHHRTHKHHHHNHKDRDDERVSKHHKRQNQSPEDFRRKKLQKDRDDSPRRGDRDDNHRRDKEKRDDRTTKSKWDDNDDRKRESDKWGKGTDKTDDKKSKENVAKPDFGLSGKLAEETNTYRGIVIKYSQPPEARMPKRRWRLYPFKGDEVLPTIYIHRQSAYLIGRDRVVADFPVDHPSISKQHAVLQYRVVPYTREDGKKARRVRPYLIDLDSANGTFINNKKIDPRKYVELLERDVIKFAFSSREYVLLHEHSQDDAADEDDNVPAEEQVQE